MTRQPWDRDCRINVYCGAHCCSASKVHQGRCSLAAKNPGTEHSVGFSPLLLLLPTAAPDDGLNKNSASDLVAFALADG